jgi:hypothetical protein
MPTRGAPGFARRCPRSTFRTVRTRRSVPQPAGRVRAAIAPGVPGKEVVPGDRHPDAREQATGVGHAERPRAPPADGFGRDHGYEALHDHRVPGGVHRAQLEPMPARGQGSHVEDVLSPGGKQWRGGGSSVDRERQPDGRGVADANREPS